MKTHILLVAALWLLTGCVSTPVSQLAQLDTVPSSRPVPLLMELTREQTLAVTRAVTASLQDPASARFEHVYAVSNPGAEAGYVICGQVVARNNRGADSEAQLFAFSRGRSMILDEATNWGFIKPESRVMLRHRARPFAGSWWVACRPQAYTALVQQFRQAQETRQAQR